MTLREKIFYQLNAPGADRFELHMPERVDPDPAEKPLVERIFASYVAMKEAQQLVKDPALLPSPIWQKHLDQDYEYMNRSLTSGTLDSFHYFLANFGSWDSYTGVESSGLYSKQARRSRLEYRKVVDQHYHQLYTLWQGVQSRARDEDLHYPPFGNQQGALLDGVFIGPGSFFNDFYGRIIQGILNPLKSPLLADLGGGYGKLAYFSLRHLPGARFVDVDLPEVLCLAAYYLLKAWPDKKALLYGEVDEKDIDFETHSLTFLPNFCISRIPAEGVDLFLNKNSLGEMTRANVDLYLKEIQRTTRLFLHLNHDKNRRLGDDSYLAQDYPIGPPAFRCLARFPDISYLQLGSIDPSHFDIFFYLYEKMSMD